MFLLTEDEDNDHKNHDAKHTVEGLQSAIYIAQAANDCFSLSSNLTDSQDHLVKADIFVVVMIQEGKAFSRFGRPFSS